MSKRPALYWDLETYPNFFLFGFLTDDPAFQGWKCYLSPEKPTFTPEEREYLAWLARTYTWYGFNTLNYDCPMWRYAMAGAGTAELKQLNDAIIPGPGREGLKRWEIERAGWPQAVIPEWDCVDIMEVLPGVRIGLKTYMARNHSETLQDLPYPPDTHLTYAQQCEVWNYHNNDLRGTRELTQLVRARLALRERIMEKLNNLPAPEPRYIARDVVTGIGDVYGPQVQTMYELQSSPPRRPVDLRSKSDAQMSEAIMAARLGYRPEVPYIASGTRFRLIPAPWLSFATQYMHSIYQLCCSVEFEFNRKDPGEELPDGTKPA
jgi:hypothetical protein